MSDQCRQCNRDAEICGYLDYYSPRPSALTGLPLMLGPYCADCLKRMKEDDTLEGKAERNATDRCALFLQWWSEAKIPNRYDENTKKAVQETLKRIVRELRRPIEDEFPSHAIKPGKKYLLDGVACLITGGSFWSKEHGFSNYWTWEPILPTGALGEEQHGDGKWQMVVPM